MKPAGLGARDTLRLEARLSLYGNDIDETTNPLEAGLGWVTKLDKREKEDFVGRAALEEIHKKPLPRKLVGFEVTGRGIARHGYPLRDLGGHSEVGVCTSGRPGPDRWQEYRARLFAFGDGRDWTDGDSWWTAAARTISRRSWRRRRFTSGVESQPEGAADRWTQTQGLSEQQTHPEANGRTGERANGKRGEDDERTVSRAISATRRITSGRSGKRALPRRSPSASRPSRWSSSATSPS